MKKDTFLSFIKLISPPFHNFFPLDFLVLLLCTSETSKMIGLARPICPACHKGFYIEINDFVPFFVSCGHFQGHFLFLEFLLSPKNLPSFSSLKRLPFVLISDFSHFFSWTHRPGRKKIGQVQSLVKKHQHLCLKIAIEGFRVL